MTEREELFKETEEHIDDTTKKLREHFYALGILVFKNPQILPSPMGVSLLKAVEEAEAALIKAQEKKKDDESFLSEYEKNRSEKIEKDEILERLRNEEREIRLRLGALIYEQCSLSLLPRENFSSVYDDADEEKTLNEKTLSKSFWSRFTSSSALSRFKHSDTSRYLDYSSFADKDENAVLISGEKAQSLISSLNEIKEKRTITSGEEEALEEYLSSNLSRKKLLDKGEKEENDALLEEKENDYRECVINYGNYLYDRGGSWIGEETPSDVLDVIQLILENQKEYSSLNKRKEQLQKEAKADDYKAMIEEEKAKIRILEDEKRKIDREIEEIEREINRLSGMVNKLVKNPGGM